MRTFTVVVLSSVMAASPASAEDGYCEYVEGRAAAESAVMFAPDLFFQFGYIEQSPVADNPDVGVDGLRFIGGVRVKLDGIYEGLETRARAKSDCKRYAALAQVSSETAYRALEARGKVLDGALDDAEKIQRQVNADLDARRTTAQEATATKLRIEELRRLAEDTHRALAALPPPKGGEISGALAAFRRADAEVEQHEGRLRRAAGFDLSVRLGIDSFLGTDVDQQSPYFAVVSANLNLGVLFQGKGNARAAAGRAALLNTGGAPGGGLAMTAATALAEGAARRAEETGTLEADLEKQLTAMERIGGDESKRYRMTVWFDLVKIRAEHAYHVAHAAALAQVVAGGAP